MTLRQKILLLGVFAIAGMVFALWLQYGSYSVQVHAMELTKRNVRAVGTLSFATHELQKERGLTTMAPSARDDPTLVRQVRNTDAALARLAGAGIDIAGLRESLARLRTAVTAKTIDLPAARDAYSGLVHTLIDEMDRLTREPEVAVAATNISAHAHLVAAKEYLGQMRATLGYWVEHRRDDSVSVENLIRLKTIHEEELRKLRREASPELRDVLAAQFSGQEVEKTLHAVARITATGSLPQELDASAWWSMATLAIDRLKIVEDHSLQLIEKEAEDGLAQLRSAMRLGVIATVASGLVILALVLSATLSLLRALDRILASIELISASEDFKIRIPADSPDEIGRISRSFNELLDIAERLLKEKDRLANTDTLTGANNRLRFAQVLGEEAERKRRNKTPMALIMLDIDHFKRVNDTYGHNVGDEVLKAIAKLVGSEIRATDFFGRWGGEEFVLLLRDDGCDAAVTLAEKLRTQIAVADFPTVGKLTCSFGVAAWEQDDTEANLVARADKALYESKRAGRNRVCCQRTGRSDCPGRAACGQ